MSVNRRNIPAHATAILTPLIHLDSEHSTVGQGELDRLLTLALQHIEHHEPFFRALLDATVYAHLPLSDDSGRIRFIQFNSPDDGRPLLPFFTDLDKALAVGRTDVRILALQGRTLLQHTLGATLVMNPNDRHSILYPEETRALLETGRIAQVWTEQLSEARMVALRAPSHAPKWLIEKLKELQSLLPFVVAAYLVGSSPPDDLKKVELRLGLAVAKTDAERAVRAITVHLGARLAKLRTPLTMTTFEPTEPRPEWLSRGCEKCLFDRGSK